MARMTGRSKPYSARVPVMTQILAMEVPAESIPVEHFPGGEAARRSAPDQIVVSLAWDARPRTPASENLRSQQRVRRNFSGGENAAPDQAAIRHFTGSWPFDSVP